METKSQSAFINLFELEELARQRLTQMAFDYYVSGANDEVTVAENCDAYKRIQLSPRMLVDVSSRSLTTTALGQAISMPIMVAPTAFQGLAHEQGEIATALAAAECGTIMTLSTLSTSSIEEVMAATTGPVWFQLYVYRDKEVTADLVKRAESAGCKAVVLTVDSPFLGRRERDVRNGFHLPPHLTAKNLIDAGFQTIAGGSGSGLASYIASLYSSALTWDDLEWLCSITKLPVLVKGIMRADDALLAIKHGASGIVVSNHGGRQLDTVPATISVLPHIADAVDGEVEIFLDGGIRRGTDILKAIAYGARAVLVGRPILWGLAVDGKNGVKQVLEMLRNEMELAMALCGCPSADKITKDIIWTQPGH